MIGQPDGHRWRPRPIPPPSGRPFPASRKARWGRSQLCSNKQRITSASQVLVVFAGLTRQRIQPIAQHAIQPFLMHRIGAIHRLTQNLTHLHAHHHDDA